MVLTFVFCLVAQRAYAHPISLSAAVVDVHERDIEVNLQIMLEDLVLYHRLQADEHYIYSAHDLRTAAEKHETFVLDYFAILDASGTRLVGRLETLDMAQIDAQGVPQTELMRKSVNYQLSYPLDGRQAFLTISQTFGGPNAVLPALMDLMVLQGGTLIGRPTQLTPGRPHTTAFDWDNPPTDAPRTFRELRQERDEQRRQRLGITTYGGLYSFLYVTRFEVRHEILIPLLTLEQWVPLPRKDPDFLEVEEQQAARAAVELFFQSRNAVSINGERVSARLTRLNFFGLDINDFALNAEPRRVSIHQARVGVIISYPSRETPADLAMAWTTFSDHAPFLRSIVLIGNGPPLEHYFRQNQPEFNWRGELIGTQVAPIPATSRSLTRETTGAVLEGLLTNVYGAFDFRDDSDVYDALATSVAGELLQDLYLRVKRSLLMAEQGGALAHVDRVEILSVSAPLGRVGQTTDGTWRVTGTVEHWGHVHTRVNEYHGRVTLMTHGKAWKIQGLDLLDEKRIKFKTGIRGYDQ